jgi:hypothetical protein
VKLPRRSVMRRNRASQPATSRYLHLLFSGQWTNKKKDEEIKDERRKKKKEDAHSIV